MEVASVYQAYNKEGVEDADWGRGHVWKCMIGVAWKGGWQPLLHGHALPTGNKPLVQKGTRAVIPVLSDESTKTKDWASWVDSRSNGRHLILQVGPSETPQLYAYCLKYAKTFLVLDGSSYKIYWDWMLFKALCT